MNTDFNYMHSPNSIQGSSNHSTNSNKIRSNKHETVTGSRHFLNVLRRFSSSRSVSKHLRSKRKSHPLQRYIDNIVRSRGYSTLREDSLTSLSYNIKATSYQKASFGERVVEVVETGDCEKLRKLINAGISPNPYDVSSGEYLIHKVCRRGDYKSVKVMIEIGGPDILRAVDVYGRTPLHVVCESIVSQGKLLEWQELASIIIECEPQMLYMTDCNHAEPLTYVPKSYHREWIQLLDSIKDKVWPICYSPTKSNTELSQVIHGIDNIYSLESPCAPLASPGVSTISPSQSTSTVHSRRRKKHVPIEVASMLSSGKMDEEEVQILQHTVVRICHRRVGVTSDKSKPDCPSIANSRSSSFSDHDYCTLYSEQTDDNELLLSLDEFTIDEILSDDDETSSIASNDDDPINIQEVLELIDLNFAC